MSSLIPANAPPGEIITKKLGVSFGEEITYERWLQAGHDILNEAAAACWRIGDWLIYGETRYPKRYPEALEATGLEYQTLRNYHHVAGRYQLYRRRYTLSFSHHSAVASILDDKAQDQWLDVAEQQALTVHAFRAALQSAGVLKNTAPRELSAPALHLNFTIDERAQRWQAAAERLGQTLEQFAADALDSAAQVILAQAA